MKILYSIVDGYALAAVVDDLKDVPALYEIVDNSPLYQWLTCNKPDFIGWSLGTYIVVNPDSIDKFSDEIAKYFPQKKDV